MNFTQIFEFESLIGDIYGVFKYEDLDFKSYKQVKHKDSRWGDENHNRTIYQTDKYFVKVWDEDYIRANTLPSAFASGFYDSTIVPNFVGMIYDENNTCRGYITKECTQLWKREDSLEQDLVRLTDKSDHYIEEMFTKVKLKTLQSRHFAYDFCENHTYEFEGKPTLIDLEGVYPIEYYEDLNQHHYNTYTRANAGDRVDGDYLESPKFFSNFMAQKNYEHFVKNLLATAPINLEYFLNMDLQQGSGGKEIIHNDKTLKTVREVIEYFSDDNNVKETEKKVNKDNHQYWNGMWAEFRINVEDHHKRGWSNMTKEYYDSLEPMTDEEIRVALVDDPVNFFGGFLKHGYHRAVAMIGRLINGKSYIPFYMPAREVFKGNVENPLRYINYLEMMDIMGFPKEEYAICNSAILAVMGVDARKNKNGDLDLVFSSKLRKQIEDENIELPKEIHPFGKDSGKFRFFGCEDDDDLVYNYSVNIGGYNFAEPRFYFSRMHMVKPSAHRSLEENRKIKQDGKDGVDKFIEMKSYKGFPFDKITQEQWGFDLIQEVG